MMLQFQPGTGGPRPRTLADDGWVDGLVAGTAIQCGDVIMGVAWRAEARRDRPGVESLFVLVPYRDIGVDPLGIALDDFHAGQVIGADRVALALPTPPRAPRAVRPARV